MPIDEKTLSLPLIPSITISRLPIVITQKPQKTRACIKPVTGFLKIFVCPIAILSIIKNLLPKSLIGNVFVSLKISKSLRIV